MKAPPDPRFNPLFTITKQDIVDFPTGGGGLIVGTLGAAARFQPAALLGSLFLGSFYATFVLTAFFIGLDPDASTQELNLHVPPFEPEGAATISKPETAAIGAGAISGVGTVENLALTGSLAASWSTSGTSSSFQARSLSAPGAAIKDAEGRPIGSGLASLSIATAIPIAISGDAQYRIDGQGRLSFYGAAENGLGVGGDWVSYSATATGLVGLSLTTDSLRLNGVLLAAGTYTITAASAALIGDGATASPNFSGAATIDASGTTLVLGPGLGGIAVGGNLLDPRNGSTFAGYSGRVVVSAGGDGMDEISLSGDANEVLAVAVHSQLLTADQNTPARFTPLVRTSFADTYSITARVPEGWTVAINAAGEVVVTPAPGTQTGTFPVAIIARSLADPRLVAQAVVDLTVTPTRPAMTLDLESDPQFTVPFNGVQLPTAFLATIRNLGPAVDTYTLSFDDVSGGYTLLNSGTSVTVPAGQAGILGLYLSPTPGQVLPEPGTVLTFTVTATNATDPSLTQTRTASFTVPAISAITITSSQPSVSTIPGAPVTATITITNAGNLAEPDVILAGTGAPGLAIAGLEPVSLEPGQSTTQIVTLTPDAMTPLNAILGTTVTASFGPTGASLIQAVEISVRVVVPGAGSLVDAAVAAGQLGNPALAYRLDDLSIALTKLVQTPTSAVFKSQALASLDSIISLLAVDSILVGFVAPLAAAQDELSAATTASAIQSAVQSLGGALDNFADVTQALARGNFELFLNPNSQVAQPQVPAQFELLVHHNIGTSHVHLQRQRQRGPH